MCDEHTNIVTEKGVEIYDYIQEIGTDQAKMEILNGLYADQKFISPKYFYDKKGSLLFEEITRLKEYYPTRTEKSILSSIIDKMDFDLTDIDIVELGSGDASKISLIFNQIPKSVLSTINYVPVDISKDAIEKSADIINQRFKLKSIAGIITDFHQQLSMLPTGNRRLFCFLGSTIGNFNKDELIRFSRQLGSVMQSGDLLLLGTDLVKDISILEAAYNDEKGITEQFNKNILSVVNSLIGSDFNEEEFVHHAFYNSREKRIEMHLKAKSNQNVSLSGLSPKIYIAKGETIHTENSYKFTEEDISFICELSGLKVNRMFTDPDNWYNIVFAEKK